MHALAAPCTALGRTGTLDMRSCNLMLLPLERSSISKTAAGPEENLPGTITRTPSLCGSSCKAPRLDASFSTRHCAYSWGFLPEITLMVGSDSLISATFAQPLTASAKGRTRTPHFIQNLR